MKQQFIIIIALLTINTAFAQQDRWQELLQKKMPALPMASCLYQLGTYLEIDKAFTLEKVKEMNLVNRGEQLYVEFVDYKNNIERAEISNLPAEITTIWKNRASAWVKISDLLKIANDLSSDLYLSAVYYPTNDDEGPGVMGSDNYITNGANGGGIDIAVFDGGFNMLTEARAASAAPTPANTTVFNPTGDPLESGSQHGTGCVETVFDHAPAADYFLCKIYSLSDMGDAVDWCITQGVDIISHSISRYNLGWNDNTGAACAAVQTATNAGILFFTSAGNRNGTHWQGAFSDPDIDGNHNWQGNDEQNDFTVNDMGTVSINLQWNASPLVDAYDLFLVEDGTDIVLASSTNLFGYESIGWTNSSGSTMNVYLAVVAGSAGFTPAFEVFNHDNGAGNFEYASTNSSTTSPSNSTQANCISVGALPLGSYGSASGTSGIIASYSSRGPTNDGALAPDICAPTNTTTVAYGGAFGGTSCATPNAAGAAAAFWSAHPGVSANGIRAILFRKAQLYNDWGASGPDNLYGNGGLELYNWVANTVYIHSYNPAQPVNQQPYPGPQQADDFAPVDAHAVFLGGLYFAPNPGSILLDKEAVYRSLIEDAITD